MTSWCINLVKWMVVDDIREKHSILRGIQKAIQPWYSNLVSRFYKFDCGFTPIEHVIKLLFVLLVFFY